MAEKNLYLIYSDIIENIIVDEKRLSSYGYDRNEVNKLIAEDFLKKRSDGTYTVAKSDNLIIYGRYLVGKKDFEKAAKCFKKCYELYPNEYEVGLQVLLSSTKEKKFEESFACLDSLYEIADTYQTADLDFYLYMLNIITEVPERYKMYAKFLNYNNFAVRVNDQRYDDVRYYNELRTNANNKKFKAAIKIINDLMDMHGNFNIDDLITRDLLYKCAEKQTEIKNNVLYYINNKRYGELVDYLEGLQARYKLSINDEHVLSIAKDIIRIVKTKKIPPKEVTSTDRLFEAINNKDYELALKLSNKYTKEDGINTKTNIMYLILLEINKLIDIVKKQAKEKSKSSLNNKELVDTKLSKSELFVYIDNLTDINSIDNVKKYVKRYLKAINKENYEFLIIDLLKLNIIASDSFTETKKIINSLTEDKFVFNLYDYVQKLYETVATKNFLETRVYLDIINNACIINKECIIDDSLRQLLNNIEKIIMNENKTSCNNDDIVLNDEKPLVDYEQLVNSKLKELEENGIVILELMSIKDRDMIHNIVSKMTNVISFEIGDEPNKQVVLRFLKYSCEEFEMKDINKIISEATKLYKNGEYDKCLELNKELLSFNNPEAWVYAKIGLTYMKKSQIKIAIDYLTIATDLAKKENDNRYDYTELIGSLKGMIPRDEWKPRIDMSTDEFKENVDESENEDVKLVVEKMQQGLSFNKACEELKYTNEQILMISLIIAREHYIHGNYSLGDQYLKIAEKIKNKSKDAVSLFDEIKRNKKFYKNRNLEGYKSYIYKSKN